MTWVVKPRPVLFACEGCSEGARFAGEVTDALNRRRFAERAYFDATGFSKAAARYPVFVIEGCATACAKLLLARRGIKPHRSFVVTDYPATDAGSLAERIAAEW
jgi:uncharacterized metal-binding protein